MRKTIISLFIAASLMSANAYSDDNDYALIAAGLVGLALIVGDGHTSFGIHYDRGYYNYRGHRYSSRAAYLRAVAQYERERRYYQRYSTRSYYRDNYYWGNSYRDNSRSRYNNFSYRYRDDRQDSRSNNSDRNDRNERNQSDRSRDESRDRDGRSNRD